MSVTFATCFYKIKSKFDSTVYYKWMTNLLENVNNFNLIIFTDEENKLMINNIAKNNKNIKIIVKSFESFYNYKYKNQWIKNQQKNIYLNFVDWELQLIWSEKINFVLECINNKYYNTEYYGWIDIGYFRCRHNDITIDEIKKWPNIEKITSLDNNKIYYGNVNNDKNFINYLFDIVNNKNDNKLPIIIIPHTQNTIAGGCFISHKNNIKWWRDTFDDKIKLYFDNNYLVKDDQIIIVDCIMSDLSKFTVLEENDNKFDNWFMFQRKLL
jgi:hypothetical protein